MALKPPTSYPILAGVFTIVSASMLIVLAIGLTFLRLGYPPGLPSWFFAYLLIFDAVGFVTDAIGLVGGITSLLRRHYVLSVIGVTLILWNSIGFMQSSVLQPLFFQSSIDFTYLLFSLGSLTALALSLVAIVSIAKSKAEFP